MLTGLTMKAVLETMKEFIRQNRQIVNVFGVIAIVVVGASLVGRLFGGDSESIASDTTISSDSEPLPTSGGPTPNSEVPPVDCGPLITFDEVLDALGVADDPDRGGGASQTSRNEVCHEELASDPDFYVQISPGSPNDFATGAVLIGTTGDPVLKLGDEALWFGGADADDGGAYGMVVVHELTQHGDLYFRVVLGRPDVDETAQREITIVLARLALPRFPGVFVETEPVEPVVVSFDDEPVPDASSMDLGQNLLAKEESGQWSRGEGLAATLGYLAGELDVSSVVSTPDLLDNSATSVIALARDYLDSGDDQAMQAEVQRLLEALTFTAEELDQLRNSPTARGLLVSAVPLAQEDSDPCQIDDPTTSCLDQIPLPSRPGVPDDKYFLFADVIHGSQWQNGDIEAAKLAILDSAAKYESLGEMPSVYVMLQAGGMSLYVDYLGPDCVLYIHEFLADFDDAKFGQIIAREMAFCLIAREFNTTIKADQVGTRWWSFGLVNYLSGYVYPRVNLEHENLPTELAEVELGTTLSGRTWTNWIFFEYLHAFLGPDGILALIKTFPEGGDHIAALAGANSMDELFHDFERGLTDANIPDQGPGTVPYNPNTWKLDVLGPLTGTLMPHPFGVRRLQITVPDGNTACFETFESGELRASWRPGVPGESGSWDDAPPVSLDGTTMLVLTAVKPGASFTIDVTDVGDDRDCEEDQEAPPTTLGECGICSPSDYFYND
jgi:hypothetical protein